MSTFFQEICKILGIHKVNTTSYHPISNGKIERLHRTLHTGLSHFVNSTNNNWDVLVPFYLMVHRATPNTTTRYSPLYLEQLQIPPLDTAHSYLEQLQIPPLDTAHSYHERLQIPPLNTAHSIFYTVEKCRYH
jgi:transposase InsO family protein